MKISEIAFVCYGVNDLKKARHFYEDILGLKPGSVWEGDGSGFIEYEIGPHTLAIGQGSENFKPGKLGGTVALEVDDIDEAVQKLKDNKIKFLMEKLESPVCFMMLVEDYDGNQIMIHKRKTNNDI